MKTIQILENWDETKVVGRVTMTDAVYGKLFMHFANNGTYEATARFRIDDHGKGEMYALSFEPLYDIAPSQQDDELPQIDRGYPEVKF